MSGGSVEFSELTAFRDKLENLSKNKKGESFSEAAVKELAARLLRKVKKRTHPVTGNLTRNWQVGNVIKNGNTYTIEIINSTEYAEYVEYGHRQVVVNKKTGEKRTVGWTKGKFMLTISEKELNTSKDAILESKLENWLREGLK